MDYTKFRENLNKLKLQDRTLTNKKIARLVGPHVTDQVISNWLTGRTPNPPIEDIAMFCKNYGVRYEWLIGTPDDYIGEMPLPEYLVSRRKDDRTNPIPFFDVDVLATPIEVFNDQTTRPAYTIDMPGFQDCDFAIKVYGHSMYPTIESGMIVLCKKVVDMDIIAYGEIYLVVTADLRMVKRLIRSDKGGHVLATSDNHNGHASPDGKTYPPIEIPLKKILHLYLVKGSFKRHLI